MYVKGKLTKEARQNLQSRYAKMCEKDNILKKIEKNVKKKQRKNGKTVHKKRTPVVVETSKKLEETVIVGPSSPKKYDIPPKAAIPDTESSECPSTPTRNDMVQERNAIIKGNEGVNWISFVKHTEKDALREESTYKQFENQAKNDNKKSLENQINVRAKNRKIEEEKSNREQEESKKLWEQWKVEDKKKADEKHKKGEKIKSMRRKQIEERKRRNEKKHKKEMRKESRRVKQLEQERLEYEQEKLDKKRKIKETMIGVLAENAAQKEIYKKEQLKLQEDEVKLQKQYAEMLKKQEEAREKRLQEMFASNEAKQQSLVENTAADREAERLMLQRIEEENTRRNNEADRRQKEKENNAKRESLQIQAYLKQQMKDKEDRLYAEIIADRKYGVEASRLAKLSLEKEKTVQEKRIQKLYKQAEYIKEQIAANKDRELKARADMNDDEKHMNADLIRIINQPEKTNNVPQMKIDPKRPFEWRYNYRKKPF